MANGKKKEPSKSLLDVAKRKSELNKKRAEAIKKGNFAEVKRINEQLKGIK